MFLKVEQFSFITESKWEVLLDGEGKIAESTFGLAAMLVWNIPICLYRGNHWSSNCCVKCFVFNLLCTWPGKEISWYLLIDLYSSIPIVTLWFLGLHCFDEQWGILGKTSQ
jgi:hypothetical protein